jgi:hypothetical protein
MKVSVRLVPENAAVKCRLQQYEAAVPPPARFENRYTAKDYFDYVSY